MDQQSPQPNALSMGTASGLSGRFWLLILGTGVGAGLGGGLLMKLLRAVQHLSWSYGSGEFLAAVHHASWERRVGILLLAGVVAGTLTWMMRQPPGGHAGELAEAVWFRSGRLPIVRTIARAILSIVIVGMGASLGREAAPKQTGAAVAALLSKGFALSATDRRLLAACGAGAGMAAVYNVPFGGALFALEVLLGTLTLPLVPPALAASLIATAVSWLFLPDRPTYSVPAYALTSAQIVWAIIAGPLAGLVAVIYVRIISWADALKPKRWHRLFAPVLVFGVLGLLALPFPQLLGNGKDAVQEAFLDQMGVALLLPLLLLKPLATAACLGSGAPGGLFTPTVTCGATLGGLFGKLWTAVWPGAPPGSYALIGAGALLAAAMEAPISSVVLMLELTHLLDALMVPLLLAVAGAVTVARLFEARSIYSGRIHSGRSAAEAERRPAATRFDRFICRDYAVVSAAAGYAEVLQALLDAGDPVRPLYVVDERGKLVGEIPRGAPSVSHLVAAQRAIATAGDLARPVRPLLSSLREADVVQRLQEADGLPLPVVDAESGRLIAAARASEPAPSQPRF